MAICDGRLLTGRPREADVRDGPLWGQSVTDTAPVPPDFMWTLLREES